MKKISLLVLFITTLSFGLSAQNGITYTDAQKLRHIGKLSVTTNPYHRAEVADYPQMNSSESKLLCYSAGQAICFETDAKEIWVQADYGKYSSPIAMPATASHGYTLYIEKDGEWIWASSRANRAKKNDDGTESLDKPLRVIGGMNNEPKRCMLYLPLFAEVSNVRIGVPEGSLMRPIKAPFRHRIAMFGSSFTHGDGATAAGMTLPAYLSRETGLNFCSYGMAGWSKLQDFMGDILGKTKADAYVCDSFSNPTINEIGERIDNFILAVRKHNPKAPIIFIRTIYRERRNFEADTDSREALRMEYVDKLMVKICQKYPDVYYIDKQGQTGDDHHTSTDGTHPFSWGYYRWAKSIEQPILDILAKYKIK